MPGRLLAGNAAARLTEWGADAIGGNCSAGPATVLTAIERMSQATSLPLVVMPNAGMPRAVDGRNIYLCSPEYMASFSRKFVKAGVRFVGGCCGTTPNHIRAISLPCAPMGAQQTVRQRVQRGARGTEIRPRPWRRAPGWARGSPQARFVTMVEIVPPKGIACGKELEGARLLAEPASM